MQWIWIGIYIAFYSIFLSLVSFFAINIVTSEFLQISGSFLGFIYKVFFFACIILSTYITFKRKKIFREWNILFLAIVSTLSYAFVSYILLLASSSLWMSYWRFFFPVLFFSIIPLMLFIFFILKFYQRIYKKDFISREHVLDIQKQERELSIEEKTVV